jgi:Zn ribbon nucleic-acid-binding protein
MESLTTRFHKEVFLPYLELLKAQYRIHPAFDHAKQTWEAKLSAHELVNGPYLEKAQNYRPGAPLESLSLHPKTIKTIRQRLSGHDLWKHQTDALRLLLGGQNAIIATGTSSGKTLCYQIPILDDLLSDPASGLRAIIIYPLNALVNDQLTEWEQMLRDHSHITFARFTGQTPADQKEYVGRIRESIREQLADAGLTQRQLQQEVEHRLSKQLTRDIQNKLNHRDAIRATPPQILITNFSMLEYLLERPVDAPIFENARLKFLVLDEAHAYRGVQSTEIAFLIRRVKDRLGLERLTCIATSATLGKKDDPSSRKRVRQFASNLFDETFSEDNPIGGDTIEPSLKQPGFTPSLNHYLQVAEVLRGDPQADVRHLLGAKTANQPLADLLAHDDNLYRLRKTLTQATRLDEAAKAIWPQDPQSKEGLQALLEIVAAAKKDGSHEDLLPTRLHYFVRAQGGLHVCLHNDCPDRCDAEAAFFVSRKHGTDVPEGDCPACHRADRVSKLVEVVSCRKCGYLFGALQDLGPRRAQSPDNETDGVRPEFDSFSTELSWAADSYWSYFSVDGGLPYPTQPKGEEEDEEQEDLFANPAKLNWCVICGKKNDPGSGDNCACAQPHLRSIQIFHRQCPNTGRARDRENLYKQEKKPLTSCPNCGARNSSGLEPVRRFQESDDEIGMAMAIPLAHFQVIPQKATGRLPRKLLCFTDNRQRAAAFPSLLEEETFSYDLGRKITEVVRAQAKPLTFVDLAQRLAEFADRDSDVHDPDFFLPVSRLPDEKPDSKGMRDLWIAETFAYFGIPDAARESAEDFGLVVVEYRVSEREKTLFRSLLNAPHLKPAEADGALQVLLGFLRQAKAFTLPRGVEPDAPAFGRVIAPISYVLRKEGIRNTKGWLPRLNQDGTYRHNFITSYLRRLLLLPQDNILAVAEQIWDFLTSNSLLIESRGQWKLDHERLFVVSASHRHVCTRCGIVTAYSAGKCCPRKECEGPQLARPFDPANENMIGRWVSGAIVPRFSTLNSEEHTAQIEKDLAKKIEDAFRAAEGVNLLSSTTTFEMGINIGDLQKVLLRNAPPTSANYVQRVGRAGRGEDKNAVCVTLCRRIKYDADAWSDPPRLMSGEVRTPTVFLSNRIIAQRHFNAMVFAQFLRTKISKEQLLGNIGQSIRLEGFLSPDSRENIPSKLRLIPSREIYLDFREWFTPQGEVSVVRTITGRSLLDAVDGFESGKASSLESYHYIFETISGELEALRNELEKVNKEGGNNSEILRAIKDLLGSDVIAVLAKRGFLPRYAFPLDVVTLETGWTRWSRDVDVELSRDRALAIAEFAPGAQVIAHKKVFTSAGLYVVSETDKPDRRWYFKCRDCEQIRTARTQDELKGGCAVCHKAINPSQDFKPFVAPVAFSVRIDKDNQGATRHRRTTLVRQRQTLTHFIDFVEPDLLRDIGLFHVALKDKGHLFRYNLGPGNKGFMLCPKCGCSEPLSSVKSSQKHKKLRVFSGNVQCENTLTWGKLSAPLAYGHEFQTFCLIARPQAPVLSVESLAYSLQKGLCAVLDIEAMDIGVSWRWLGKRTEGAKVEIILYDRTPGGAGFAKEGFDNWSEVVRRAYEVCSTCHCEKACYDCLKDYSNQTYHEKLDRRPVAEFLGR